MLGKLKEYRSTFYQSTNPFHLHSQQATKAILDESKKLVTKRGVGFVA